MFTPRTDSFRCKQCQPLWEGSEMTPPTPNSRCTLCPPTEASNKYRIRFLLAFGCGGKSLDANCLIYNSENKDILWIPSPPLEIFKGMDYTGPRSSIKQTEKFVPKFFAPKESFEKIFAWLESLPPSPNMKIDNTGLFSFEFDVSLHYYLSDHTRHETLKWTQYFGTYTPETATSFAIDQALTAC